MEYIRCLQAVQQSDSALVGGKAANLGILMQADLPVPPGFVILTSAYRQFLIGNVQGAMRRIQDGQMITVDGDTGKVFMDE